MPTAVGPHPVVVDRDAVPDLAPLPLARGLRRVEHGLLSSGLKAFQVSRFMVTMLMVIE